jgi:hypothetical protein
MRKFLWQVVMNPLTYDAMLNIHVRDNDISTKLYSGKVINKYESFETKLMSEEYFKLKFVNDVLVSKDMLIMTEDEFNYMIDPLAFSFINKPESVEDLQKLAGIYKDIPFGTEIYTDYLNRLRLSKPDIMHDGKKVTKIEINIGVDGMPTGMKCFTE